MIFFPGFPSKEEIEKEYKRLAKVLHPDKGGNEKLFQELVKQKEEKLKRCIEPGYQQMKENLGARKARNPGEKIKMKRRPAPAQKVYNINIDFQSAIEMAGNLKVMLNEIFDKLK